MEYENIKGIMGRLIALERKRLYNLTQSERYTQINLIARKGERYLENCRVCQTPCSRGRDEKDQICSRCTIIKMESGSAVLSECSYVGIIENLGYHYLLDGLIVKEMEQLEQLVLEFLSTASQELLDKLNKVIPKYKSKYKDVFYFSDLLLLYEEVISLVAEDTSTNAISEEKVKFYYEYGTEITKDITSIIVVLMYLKNMQYKELYSKVNQRISDRWECPYLFNCSLVVLNGKGRIILFDRLMKLYHERFNELTVYNQYSLLNKIAYIYLNDRSIENSLFYLEKAKDILDYSDYELIKSLKIKNFKNLGTCYYFSQNYEESIKCFLEIFKIDLNRLNFNFILLMHMLEKQDMIESIRSILSNESFHKINNSLMKRIFKYYLVKYSKKMSKELALELESIIVNDLNFLGKGTIHRKIIEEELNQWITMTRDYKMLYTFNQ